MRGLVHALNLVWPYVIAAIVAACAAWVGFKFGRRWRREWKEAIANRNEYHALKADAQLRSAQSVKVRVDASPTINFGAGVLTDMREQRHPISDLRDNRAFCAFCGRFGCGATCREAVDSGRANHPIPQHVDDFGFAPVAHLDDRRPQLRRGHDDHHRHGTRRERAAALDPFLDYPDSEPTDDNEEPF